MSLRGAKRRGNPFSLRQHKPKSNTLGEYEKCYEFALSITDWQSFSAGKRIAAPVCALVRNDMQKTEAWLRVQGRPPTVIARSEATLQSVLLAVGRRGEQYFGRIRESAYGFARSIAKLPGFPAGRTDCHTSVRTGSQ